MIAAAAHQKSDHQHQQREHHQQALTVHHLADNRAERCAGYPGGGQHRRTAPFHHAGARMDHQAERRARRHRQRTGADRQMRTRDADQIDHQRHGED